MQIVTKNLRLFVYLFLAIILTLGIYFIQKNYFTKNTSSALPLELEQAISEKEIVATERITEEQDLISDSKQTEEEEEEEEEIEEDAEELSVNEESTEIEEVLSEEPAEKDSNTLALPTPLKRANDPNILRIGFITDLHVKSNNNGKSLSDFYVSKMNYFLEKMNNVFSPNFILLNGDIIEGTRTSSEVGIKELSLVKDIFSKTTIEKYWVVGNHDLRAVNKKQWLETIKIDYLSKSFDVGNYKIIILDGSFTNKDKDVSPSVDYTRGNVSEKQVKWLKRELKKTKKEVLVFMHYPPLRDINAKTNEGLLYNARELQSIFSDYGVLAVFSGHIEDLYYKKIEGVNYFVSPGMVNYPKYNGAFSEITIEGKKINITLNYLLENGNYHSVEIKKK